MRQSPFPFSCIGTSIIPHHLSLTFPHILTEFSLIKVPITPCILSISIFPITTKMSNILVSTFTHPNTFSLSISLHKVSLIWCSIAPEVLSLPMRLPMNIIPSIHVTIDEVFLTLTMLNKIGKFTYMTDNYTLVMAMFGGIYSITMCFIGFPLSDVLVSCFVFP